MGEKGRSSAGACWVGAGGDDSSDRTPGRPSNPITIATTSALTPAAIRGAQDRENRRLARRTRSRFIIARRMEVGGERPAVDVVVPFFGPRASLERLLAGLSGLQLREGDTVTVVDNRPPAARPVSGTMQAPERQSSYYARNRGAERGRAE